ncbi:MAG: hypothetical protein R6V72_06150 [Cyclobacterium sp.]|uniref:hypothetical protein n=1 Tax=Cyclobacterium sp. TaxID=1966343 RepID=UPI003970EAFB
MIVKDQRGFLSTITHGFRKDTEAEVTLASPLGGQPPLDPKSDAQDAAEGIRKISSFLMDIHNLFRRLNRIAVQSSGKSSYPDPL